MTSALQTQINTAGGLVKITDSTFSAQSTVSVNDCFSSTYANYMIIGRTTVAAGSPALLVRLRLSGSDASGTDYNFQEMGAASTVTANTRFASQTSWYFGYTTSGGVSSFIATVMSPNIAETTLYQCSNGFRSAATTPEMYLDYGGHGLSTAYTGFTIYPASSTITGNLRVYGIRN